MSRMARYLVNGGFYYVETKSNGFQNIFKMDADYRRFINLIQKYKSKYQVRVYAYCLMPKSVHLVIQLSDANVLPMFMQGLNQSYALFFNAKYYGLGKVWGQRYKSTFVKSKRELFAYMKLVEFIPVREHQTAVPTQYLWSSCANRILGVGGVIDLLSDHSSNSYENDPEKSVDQCTV